MVKPSEKRLAHFRDLVAYDRALPGFGTSLAGMDEAGQQASQPQAPRGNV